MKITPGFYPSKPLAKNNEDEKWNRLIYLFFPSWDLCYFWDKSQTSSIRVRKIGRLYYSLDWAVGTLLTSGRLE